MNRIGKTGSNSTFIAIIGMQEKKIVTDTQTLSAIHLCKKGIVVVVALLFYVHSKHLRSCRDGQLT